MSNSAEKQAARDNEQRRRHHAANARQIFPIVRERLLASRPVLVEAHTVDYPKSRNALVIDKKTGLKVRKTIRWTQRVDKPAVFGKPVFRNALIEGKHV